MLQQGHLPIMSVVTCPSMDSVDVLMLFTGQEKLAFPTTCPSCDHSPLEADSCAPNKTLRNTMRIWLQKQKKKEEAKAAAQAIPAPAETPAAADPQPAGDVADKPVDSIEDVPQAEGTAGDENVTESAGDADKRAGSSALQANEVGLCLLPLSSNTRTHVLRCSNPNLGPSLEPLAKMNMIVAARASDRGMHFTSACAVTDACQESVAPQNETERRASNASQNMTTSVEPSTTGAPTDEQHNANAPNGDMMGNNPMMMNGMPGQMQYGFPNQPGFHNGMYGMNGMPNMMGNGNWNGMNSMGMSLYTS